MLTLSRRATETVVITSPTGEQITIVISEVRLKRCVIGIDAPRSYVVARGELLARAQDGLPG